MVKEANKSVKVLITGASGFVGSNLLSYFHGKGYETVGWDVANYSKVASSVSHSVYIDSSNTRFNNTNTALNKTSKTSTPTVKAVNLLDPIEIEKSLEEFVPDIIIHCAGSADVHKSVQNPSMDYQGNVTITHNLLFTLHKLHMEDVRFVFPSSAGVYGNPTTLPITEDTPLNPLSPYAVHKVMCEELCKYFAKNYEMKVRIARIFSAYGPGLKKQIFWDMHSKYLKTSRLDMFGTGNESRDYVYIDDVVQALYILATVDSYDVIFNVANGEETTIRNATEIFAECSGIDFEKISFNGIVREGEPLNWRADISKIRKLGYNSTITIKHGVEEYIRWLKTMEA